MSPIPYLKPAGLPDVPSQRGQRGLSIYKQIPHLNHLLAHGGIPGLTYFQTALHHVRQLLDDPPSQATDGTGWRRVRGLDPYVIAGPLGQCEAMLLTAGRPILGQPPTAGIRLCWYDSDIQRLTGLISPEPYTVDLGPAISPQDPHPSAPQTIPVTTEVIIETPGKARRAPAS